MTKLEIYTTLTEMNFDNDDVKRETLNNRIKWVINLLDCDYQSAYKAVKAVRMGEDMEDYIFCEEVKKARKNLKGIRSWWNRNAKPQYKTPLTELQFIDEVLDEYMNTGNVEMRAIYSKDGCTKNWF